MGAKKINYKKLGLLFSILLHGLIVALILIPENHLIKLGSATPIDFFVNSAAINKTATGSGVSHPAKTKLTNREASAPNTDGRTKTNGATGNQIEAEPSTAENSGSEGAVSGGVASSAFGEITDDALLTSPVQLLKAVKVPYPEEAKRANVSGRVIMTLLVDQTGRVREVKLIKGPGYGLNEAAMGAAKDFLFKPAQVKDQKVSVLIRYTYRFDLNNI